MKYLPIFLLLLISCQDRPPATLAVKHAEPAQGAAVHARIDSLRSLARSGDLLLRLGDDMMSYSIRYLSETDPSYSHVGVISEAGGHIQVLHIGPAENGADTIRTEPLDSFIKPAANLYAGLYRFGLNDAERAAFLEQISVQSAQKVHFDYWYDLSTNDRLYCSELIAKSLSKATNGRMNIPGKPLPRSMLKLMYAYFANLSTDTTLIRNRPYIALDQLYKIPTCDSVIKISLR